MLWWVQIFFIIISIITSVLFCYYLFNCFISKYYFNLNNSIKTRPAQNASTNTNNGKTLLQFQLFVGLSFGFHLSIENIFPRYNLDNELQVKENLANLSFLLLFYIIAKSIYSRVINGMLWQFNISIDIMLNKNKKNKNEPSNMNVILLQWIERRLWELLAGAENVWKM